jgi:hypothetical protein
MNSQKGTASGSGHQAGKDRSVSTTSPGPAKQPQSATPSGVSVSSPSGRVTFDSRGNSVWEWQTEETGKFSRDVSTQRLKKLEATELSIEETSKVKKPRGLGLHDKNAGGGFNPYDSGPASNKTKSAIPARKPIKDLRRYDEWLKMKQRIDNKKDDD